MRFGDEMIKKKRGRVRIKNSLNPEILFHIFLNFQAEPSLMHLYTHRHCMPQMSLPGSAFLIPQKNLHQRIW